MSIPFAAIVTPDSIVFTDPTGKTHTVSSDHVHFEQIKNIVRELGKSPSHPELFMNDLLELVNPAKMIMDRGEGKVTVQDGVVYYGNAPVHSTLTERILWGLREGFSMDPYIAFMENLMRNPSKRSVDQLFLFVERNKMGITEDGYILAYKRVRDDFKDIYSGKIDNSPGQTPWMPRNQVDDDPNSTCSKGLHACAQSYLPSYGSYEGNKIVIVKVDPADVVSIPIDYNAAKMRCCRYQVLAEYEGSDKEDLLASKSVFNTDDFYNDDDDDHNEENEYQDEYEEPELEDDFEVGDRVVCIDDDGLGQTDIHKDGVYKVDKYYPDTKEIYIGTAQGIGKFYDTYRFALVTDDDPKHNTMCDYDRGYDYGFKKGVENAQPGFHDGKHEIPEGSFDYSDGYSHGFRDGFNSEQPEQEEELETPSSTEEHTPVLSPEPQVKTIAATVEPPNVPHIGLKFDPTIGGFRPV